MYRRKQGWIVAEVAHLLECTAVVRCASQMSPGLVCHVIGLCDDEAAAAKLKEL